MVRQKILIDFTPLTIGQSGIAHDLIYNTLALINTERFDIYGFVKDYGKKNSIDNLKELLKKNNIETPGFIVYKTNKYIEKLKVILGLYSYQINNSDYNYFLTLIDTNVKINSEVKIITRVHDVIAISHSYLMNRPLFTKLVFKRYINNALKLNPFIVFNSNTTKEEFSKYFTFNNNKSAVIYCIAEVKNSEYISPRIPKTKYITFCSTIEPKKNIKTLIKAYKRSLINSPDLVLVIIGKYGWKSEWFYREVENNRNILWLNDVEDVERDSIIKNSSCFVFPSIVEGFGMPVIEAIRLRVPVVSSNIQIFKEIGFNCILTSNPLDDDALSKNIDYTLNSNNSSEIKLRTEKAFNMSEIFTKKIIFEKWNEIL